MINLVAEDRWISLGFLSGILLGFYDLSTKQALSRSSVLEMMTLSSFAGAAVWLIAMLSTSSISTVWSLSIGMQLLVLLKSVATVASWLLSYIALAKLPIGIASPVRASGPFWTFAFAWLWLGDQLNGSQTLAMFIIGIAYCVLSMAGRSDGLSLKILGKWVICILLATWLSALIAVYDKALVARYHIDPVSIQFHSAWQRAALAALCLFFVTPIRGPLKNISWGAPAFAGLFWVGGELVYFSAVAYADSQMTILSALRRASLLVTFSASAIFFREEYLGIKGAATVLLVIGFTILSLGINV